MRTRNEEKSNLIGKIIYIYIAREGIKGYRSGESIHLSPM